MIASLKSASKATAFEQWLDTVRSGSGGSGGSSPPGSGGSAGAAGSGGASPAAPSYQEEMAATLAEVAEYLAQQGIRPEGGSSDPGSLAADSSRFK